MYLLLYLFLAPLLVAAIGNTPPSNITQPLSCKLYDPGQDGTCINGFSCNGRCINSECNCCAGTSGGCVKPQTCSTFSDGSSGCSDVVGVSSTNITAYGGSGCDRLPADFVCCPDQTYGCPASEICCKTADGLAACCPLDAISSILSSLADSASTSQSSASPTTSPDVGLFNVTNLDPSSSAGPGSANASSIASSASATSDSSAQSTVDAISAGSSGIVPLAPSLSTVNVAASASATPSSSPAPTLPDVNPTGPHFTLHEGSTQSATSPSATSTSKGVDNSMLGVSAASFRARPLLSGNRLGIFVAVLAIICCSI